MTKNKVGRLQKNWKFCSYQFFFFVPLFTPEELESFHATKNVIVHVIGTITGHVRGIR